MGKIAQPAAPPPGGGHIRLLAKSEHYSVLDMLCRLGPDDPPRESQFPAFRVAAVVGGSFSIRSSLGAGVPVAGALLMGNACDGYCCRHDTSAGDRCINFDFQPAFLEQVCIALGTAGIGERFRRALLPPTLQSVAMTAVVDAIADGDLGALHEAAFEVAAAALAATHATQDPCGRRFSWRDESKAMRAARHIEANFDQPCTLEELAAEAGLSPFHFLRVFRRVLGQTPHRHVLATRLRHAARRLRTTGERVADIAAAAGFGDLSNFNASFARTFGVSPLAFRLRGR